MILVSCVKGNKNKNSQSLIGCFDILGVAKINL